MTKTRRRSGYPNEFKDILRRYFVKTTVQKFVEESSYKGSVFYENYLRDGDSGKLIVIFQKSFFLMNSTGILFGISFLIRNNI